MAYVTGEIVPTPSDDEPFKAIISIGGKIVSEWPVSSVVEGERQIIESLRNLQLVSNS